MKRLNQEEQRKLQLNILDHFIQTCDDNHLRYYVIDGTLLGTIRHNGYIPWDDDIDVCMPREDYDQFIKLYKEKYNDGKIKIIDHVSEKKYHMMFAKLHDTTTVLVERRVIDEYAWLYGIYIDIFPLDYVSSDEANRKKFLKRNYYAIRMITMNVLNTTEVLHNSKRMALIYNSLRFLMKGIPISFLTSIEDKRIRKYSYANRTSGLVRELAFGDVNFDYVLFETDFSSYFFRKFEYLDVKVPVGYDRILRSVYGDYMKLPPESERINHGLEVYYVE